MVNFVSVSKSFCTAVLQTFGAQSLTWATILVHELPTKKLVQGRQKSTTDESSVTLQSYKVFLGTFNGDILVELLTVSWPVRQLWRAQQLTGRLTASAVAGSVRGAQILASRRQSSH